MNTQRSKGLRCPLAEANIAQGWGFGDVKDIMYGIWNVVPGEIVDAKVPELIRVRACVHGFLRVLVTPRVELVSANVWRGYIYRTCCSPTIRRIPAQREQKGCIALPLSCIPISRCS